jgi:hypothetical protein
VLRIFSVVFSAVSAHAILWFYSSMDHVVDTSDPLQPFVKWGLAIGFTALGYFVSRGLVHRMLNRERIRVYLVICLLLELVEISANFAQGAVSIHSIDWLRLFSGPLYTVLVTLVYIVMPIVPLFTIALAVVDMDMDRAKQGYTVRGFGTGGPAAPGFSAGVPKGGPQRPATPTTGNYTQPAASSPTTAARPAAPSYQQGYTGPGTKVAQQERAAPVVSAAPPSPMPDLPAGQGSRVGATIKGAWNASPLGRMGRSQDAPTPQVDMELTQM